MNPTRFGSEDRINVAVVTGQHNFDVPGFHTLFRSMLDVAFYMQDLDNFCADMGQVRLEYDVLLFYNFHRATPGEEQEGRKRWAALEELGQTKQGILVLHHALLAFPEWSTWSNICGIGQRGEFGYYDDQTVRVRVADDGHPISQGLSTWEMTDETYTLPEPDGDSRVLFTTNHPRSMKALGWTRQYGESKVFCLESGHDNQAYANFRFRTIVARAIRWLAGRL
jgi:hypothetical protein